jgi:adenylate cyclase
MGLGVCSGPVTSGTVGSQRRLEYTAVGDTTSTAARLQAATRETGRALLVSDATRAALHDPPPDPVSAGTVCLRGRGTPVDVWTLHDDDDGLGIVPSPPPSRRP